MNSPTFTGGRSSICVLGAHVPDILGDDLLAFLELLELRFRDRRGALLEARAQRAREVAETGMLDLLAETTAVRSDPTWRVPPPPADLLDRRVEITGPTDAKMVINALNSGAKVFMADFEDANTPLWANLVEGQRNLAAAVHGDLRFESPDGRSYELGDKVATLVVRPRGWHLDEPRVLVDGAPVSGALFDFGVYLWSNFESLAARGSGPYYYLPKLQHHLEARLWSEVFSLAEDELGLTRGTIRATVLIETITAAFQMEEILYELRHHALGLNAGRWDYLFSIVKTFRSCGSRFVLPDRNSIAMTAPFMRAYAQLLVATCHRRGAMAIGGMSAFIPSRRDAEVNVRTVAAVREDKAREAGDGFDGTWVAHPDLVAVATEAFNAVLEGRPNQLDRQCDVVADVSMLLGFDSAGGSVTMAGVANNVQVGVDYLTAWLGGQGAVAINNLMEDVATAEIARSQLWQWIANGTVTAEGTAVTADLVTKLVDELVAERRDHADQDRLVAAADLFRQLVLGEFVDFLTVPAMHLLQD